ncbi:unnamed protein product [Colias eurytheme]|nr:unnamed protein product [Colias eurytheme]
MVLRKEKLWILGAELHATGVSLNDEIRSGIFVEVNCPDEKQKSTALRNYNELPRAALCRPAPPCAARAPPNVDCITARTLDLIEHDADTLSDEWCLCE